MVCIYLQYHQVNYGDDINKVGCIGPRAGHVAQLRHTVELGESISWRVLCDSMMNMHVTLGIWLSVHDVGSSIQGSDVV